MNNFIKDILQLQGYYFTPDSVMKKLKLEVKKKEEIKMDFPKVEIPFSSVLS